MSLRPSERVEVRRNRYKVAVDAEEGRRRREDNMVEIRKNRREESLLKRRREGLQAQVPAPPSGVEKKVRIRRPLRSLFRFLFFFFFCCCDGILVLGLCRDWTSVQYKCGRSLRLLSNAKMLYSPTRPFMLIIQVAARSPYVTTTSICCRRLHAYLITCHSECLVLAAVLSATFSLLVF